MRRRYHWLGLNGDVSGLVTLCLILFGLVCWFFTVPVVGFLLLVGLALCLSSEPTKPNPLERRITTLGLTTAVVSIVCVVGPVAWLIRHLVER